MPLVDFKSYSLGQIVEDLIDQKGEAVIDPLLKMLKVLNRQKVDPAREKRKRFTWPDHRRMYAWQKGVCGDCGLDMPLIQGKVHIDHIDPHRLVGFNDRDNLRLCHAGCNLSKGAKSLPQMAKETGKTVKEMVE